MNANNTMMEQTLTPLAHRVVYETSADPQPIFPQLRRFYEVVVPLSWPLVRIAVALPLLQRAWFKILAGPDKIAPAFASMGFTNPHLVALISTWTEALGGLGLLLGLFTRFFGAAIAIEMAYITFGLYWMNGFSWLNRGYEYTLMWGLICFAISLRGGGPYSIDRLLRREL